MYDGEAISYTCEILTKKRDSILSEKITLSPTKEGWTAVKVRRVWNLLLGLTDGVSLYCIRTSNYILLKD